MAAIEGVGSICSAIAQKIIPEIGEKYLYYIISVMALIGTISLLPIGIKEFREVTSIKRRITILSNRHSSIMSQRQGSMIGYQSDLNTPLRDDEV